MNKGVQVCFGCFNCKHLQTPLLLSNSCLVRPNRTPTPLFLSWYHPPPLALCFAQTIHDFLLNNLLYYKFVINLKDEIFYQKNDLILTNLKIYFMNPKTYLFSICLAYFVSGCSSLPGDLGIAGYSTDLGNNSKQAEPTRTQVFLKAGAEYLQKGEIDKAQSVFNTGLKFDLNNAALHFLNAFAYQLKFENGDIDAFANAEAGFKTSVALDATLDVAYLQLGRLYMSSTKYVDAKKAFALAVDSKQKNPQEGLM